MSKKRILRMLIKWIKNILGDREKPRCFSEPAETNAPDIDDREKNTEEAVNKPEIKPCPKCGGEPSLVLGYDFEYVICDKCKCRTETMIGDYYDEGFMEGSYVIPKWNAGIVIN